MIPKKKGTRKDNIGDKKEKLNNNFKLVKSGHFLKQICGIQ